MDEKIECSDIYVVQNLFIPIMPVSKNIGSRANLQTFFLMEKVLVSLPTNGTTKETKEIILVYDSGSGQTVGNDIESLDQFKVQKFTNLVLSSLNGIDKSQKRVCEISILQNSLDSCSLEVICPQDNIPKPFPQSMSLFTKEHTNRYKQSWVSDITEKDLNNLPIVLLGLSDIRNFPIPTEQISQKLLKKFSHLQFYHSRITGKKWLQE